MGKLNKSISFQAKFKMKHCPSESQHVNEPCTIRNANVTEIISSVRYQELLL